MHRYGEATKEFVDTIGNSSRLRILLALWKSGQELRVYRVCCSTGLGRSSARRHLNNLVESGLVTKNVYGEIVLYSLNKVNPRLKALVKFFDEAKLSLQML